MLEIAALRETEQWTGPSRVAAVLLAAAVLAVLVWVIYRYLQD